MSVSLGTAQKALGLPVAAASDSRSTAVAERDPLETRIEAVTAQVERYASEAPEAVKDEAVLRVLGYLLDGAKRHHDQIDLQLKTASHVGESSSPLQFPTMPDRPQPNAFYHSGASALLAPWRVHGAGAI